MTGGPLQGRCALITGATSGIGEATARAITAAGGRAIVHGLSGAAAEALAIELGTRAVAGDLADPQTPARIAAELADEPRLDILVNNAATEQHAELADLDRDAFLGTLEVDLVAPLQLMRLLLPQLSANGTGSIVNITSIHDTVPVRGNGAYAAAKAALSMLTRTAAIEFAADRVRVNAVAPGAIETDLNRQLLDDVGRHNFNEWIPMGRVGSVEEVASVVTFLASDAAGYMTGSTVVVDGGYTQHLVRYPRS